MLRTILAVSLTLMLSHVAAAQVTVVTSIKPLQLIAHAVTDGVSEPAVLIPANQSYHHFVMKPSTVRAISTANLLVWVGPELETWLADTLAERDTETVEVLALPGLTVHHAGYDEHDNVEILIPQQGDHAGHQHKQGHSIDPHIWLDTDNALLIAQAMVSKLSALDPVNAGRYQHNLASFSQQLISLRDRLKADLMPLQSTDYAVYHNAFQYFERQFNLSHQLVFVESEELQPGVRHMLAVRRAIEERPLTCVLEDVTAQASTVNTLLGNQPVNRIQADTTGQALTSGPRAYVNLMENLANAFKRCQVSSN
ncbi:zinc ABC transporter substrate-binding protein [Pseudohongiella sp. SYSU M77423]|uniref:zinc ABC transporter substrate-binding protein n=1 Tax=unclassified Pseudohongiella TaxID=2629611 RepID=UPI001F1ADA98|nr:MULTISPECIES: zinc ABC transporter substrate-binding protein [unclassified Pseudohongiella]MDH7944229.1 zinc ABC transporter substrate-binding protein [Pseudohongiella sp. SYSU M77423]